MSSDDLNSATIILPCAGEGSRLALPYPKEIHHVGQNQALIDFSLQMLERSGSQVDKIVVVLNSNKTLLIKHLEKWRSRFNIVFCYFDDDYREWPGSVLSAQHLFGEKNIVLLPDSTITERADTPLITTMIELLDHSGLVFAAKRISGENISALGALSVNNEGSVDEFCDKPRTAVDRYNAFWCSFGFRRRVASPVLQTFSRSVARESVSVEDMSAGRISAFWVDEYKDLGTWLSIKSLG